MLELRKKRGAFKKFSYRGVDLTSSGGDEDGEKKEEELPAGVTAAASCGVSTPDRSPSIKFIDPISVLGNLIDSFTRISI